MRITKLLLSVGLVCAVNTGPFSNLCQACTVPPPVPERLSVRLIQHSASSIWIIVNGLKKSPAPDPPDNGCACAFRNLASISSIDAVQFQFANGLPIPSNLWTWAPSPSANSEWGSQPGAFGGTWEAFKGCSCGAVPAGTEFGIRFRATIAAGTSIQQVEQELLSAAAVLGTDATNDFLGNGGPSNGSHQAFWAVSNVTIQTVGSVPTVSEWGLIAMLLLSMTTGTVMYGRWRRAGAIG